MTSVSRGASTSQTVGTAGGTSGKAKKRSEWAVMKKNYPVTYLIPAGIMLAIFFIVPTVMNFVYAFTDWSAFKATINFNGLENFRALMAGGTMVKDLGITLVFAISVAVFQNLFGLCLAVFLEEDTRINRIARVLFFIPVIMSALAVGYIWQAILKANGALDQILGFFVGHPVSIAWLGSTSLITIVLVGVIQSWKWMGLSMLIFLAGLKTIDPDIIEAASVDGASPSQVFWKVKFPLLAPAFTFNLATSLLGSMNGFDMVKALTDGGPGGSTEIINLFVWRTFGAGLYSQSTTMSLVLFVLVAIIALPVIGLLRKRERNIL